MRVRVRPIAVRRGTGPVHIANGEHEPRFVTACGKKIPGVESVVPVRLWERGRRCPACEEIVAHAPTDKMLAKIACW